MLAALAAATVTWLSVTPGVTWERPDGGAHLAAVVMPTCVPDVWLTIGAGEKATVSRCETPVVTPAGTGAIVEGWGALRERNEHADLGALAAALARDGECVGADGPNAALAAADANGHVTEYRAATPRCAVQLTERGAPAGAYVIDVRVPERLHLGSVVRPAVQDASLTGTPKRGGLLTLPDVTRMLADAGVGVTPLGAPGDPRDLDRLANARQRLNGYWVAGLISFPLLLLIALALRRRVPPRVAVAVAAYAPAGFVVGLVPWWRWGTAGAVLAVLAATLALASVADLLGRIGSGLGARRPELALCAVVAAAFAVDLLGPQTMQKHGLASYSMLTGGRFYGLGNLGFAVLATAVVVLAGAVAARHGRRVWLAALAALALLDAVPGADFGGVVAVAAACAAALTRRLRVVALAAVAGLGAALGVAYADSRRDDPTHLGRFLTDDDAGGTVARKALSALASVATAWPLLVVGCAVGAWLLVRGRPELRDTARVLAVLLVVGSLVNDSGIVVAGGGLALATPLLVSYRERRA